MEREKLSSRLGFILLSAGCAIGCGNVWKFPWMTGQYGGGAFVVVYIIFLIILGLPAMTIEFTLGRASQASIVRMYYKLEKPKQKWHIHGYVALFGNVCLMAFYTVVTGWFIYYFAKFLTGDYSNLGFSNMISDPKINVICLAIAIAIAFVVLCFNVSSGLERVTKVMMVALLILMIMLAIRCGFFDGAAEGYEFYLIPDFSKITPSVIVAAMNQAFFTLSIGIGAMAIFGSYIGKDRSLMGESVSVIILDTIVAIVAGLIIFPSCFAFDMEVTAGPGLLFDTMAQVFMNMEGGRIWGTFFFAFMVFAAMSTELAVCENILACVREMTGWTRKKGCLICGLILFGISLTTALGYSVITFQPFGDGTAFLDFWDFIVSNNLLPLGAIVMAIFCTNKRFGWGWKNFIKEANEGNGMKVKNWMYPVFAYIMPVCTLIVYIVGMVSFF